MNIRQRIEAMKRGSTPYCSYSEGWDKCLDVILSLLDKGLWLEEITEEEAKKTGETVLCYTGTYCAELHWVNVIGKGCWIGEVMESDIPKCKLYRLPTEEVKP
jgi:hypothetical protein